MNIRLRQNCVNFTAIITCLLLIILNPVPVLVYGQELNDPALEKKENLPIKKFVDEVYKLFDSQQPQKAQKLIERRLKDGTNQKRLTSLLASSHVHQKDYDNFFEAADKSLSIEEADKDQSELAIKEIDRGFARCYDDAINFAREGNFKMGLELLDRLQKYNYRSEAMAIDRIVIAGWQEKNEEAIKLYEQLGEGTRKPDYLLNTMISVYQRAGQQEKLFNIYQQLLNVQPQNVAVRNFAEGQKVQALRDLQASSLLIEKSSQGGENIPSALASEAQGDLAMHHIRWHEEEKALQMLNGLLAQYEQQMKQDPSNQRLNQQYWRARHDRLIALKELSLMKEVIADYENILASKVEIPFWTHMTAAGAYLHERQPEKAKEIYEMVYAKNPKDTTVRLALFNTYCDLRDFKKATSTLEQLDSETPKKAIVRGVLQENWNKADIAIDRAWLLMDQDRLKEASFYIEDLHYMAPFNTNIKAARAQNFLWRGWPRKSLRAFQEIQTITPDLLHARIGYAHALYANMYKREAWEIISGILKQEPQNRFALRSKKQFELEEMATLSSSASYLREKPGEDEFLYTVTGEQPIGYHHTLFAELRRRRTTTPTDPDVTRRVYVGDRWDINRTWTLVAALASDYKDTHRFGGFAEAIYNVNDHWQVSANYEKNSFDVPLRSRAAGVDADEYGGRLVYRASEIFNSSVGLNFKDFDDGNDNFEYYWRTDTALFTRANWKLRLQSDFGAATYSNQDVAYFSPQEIYSFYLVPVLEHTWYQRYERSMKDRTYVGIGQMYQHESGAENPGFVQYEQEYGLNNRSSLLWGIRYNLNFYDGSDVNSLFFYTNLAFKF